MIFRASRTFPHPRFAFSKKLDDFIEDSTQSKQNPKGENDLIEPFKSDEDEFTDSKRNTMYMFGAASITLGGLLFLMEVNKVRSDRKTAKDMSVK